MNKHNSEAANCRDLELRAGRMPYIAMLFGEDGRRWIGLVSTDEFKRAQSREARSDGGIDKINLESLSLGEIHAGEGPSAQVFDALLRRRPVYA